MERLFKDLTDGVDYMITQNSAEKKEKNNKKELVRSRHDYNGRGGASNSRAYPRPARPLL
jgi:spore maturation protein CgeB